MISAIVSALHVLALALGLPSIFFRGRALKGSLDGPGLHRLFTADTVWGIAALRSEEHTSELQSRLHLVCRLLLEKKKKAKMLNYSNSRILNSQKQCVRY